MILFFEPWVTWSTISFGVARAWNSAVVRSLTPSCARSEAGGTPASPWQRAQASANTALPSALPPATSGEHAAAATRATTATSDLGMASVYHDLPGHPRDPVSRRA